MLHAAPAFPQTCLPCPGLMATADKGFVWQKWPTTPPPKALPDEAIPPPPHECPAPAPAPVRRQLLGLALVAIASIIFGTSTMLVKVSPLPGVWLMQARCLIQWALSLVGIVLWRVLHLRDPRRVTEMLFGRPQVLAGLLHLPGWCLRSQSLLSSVQDCCGRPPVGWRLTDGSWGVTAVVQWSKA